MLIVTFREDGTGDRKIGNYDVLVSVNGQVIAQERIEGHLRERGWRELLRMLAEQQEGGAGDE